MNWNDPRVQLSLKDLREMLDARGRDSRLVRAAFRWSRTKKKFLERTKQWFYGLKSHEDKKALRFACCFGWWAVWGMRLAQSVWWRHIGRCCPWPVLIFIPVCPG